MEYPVTITENGSGRSWMVMNDEQFVYTLGFFDPNKYTYTFGSMNRYEDY